MMKISQGYYEFCHNGWMLYPTEVLSTLSDLDKETSLFSSTPIDTWRYLDKDYTAGNFASP